MEFFQDLALDGRSTNTPCTFSNFKNDL
jgi:hypothetical protein